MKIAQKLKEFFSKASKDEMDEFIKKMEEGSRDNSPFESLKDETHVIRKQEDIKNPDKVLLGTTRDFTIVNKTDSPDEMFSLMVYMLNNTMETIIAYEENIEVPQEERVDKSELMDRAQSIIHTYSLINAGMTLEEAEDVTKMKGTVHEVIKKKTTD